MVSAYFAPLFLVAVSLDYDSIASRADNASGFFRFFFERFRLLFCRSKVYWNMDEIIQCGIPLGNLPIGAHFLCLANGYRYIKISPLDGCNVVCLSNGIGYAFSHSEEVIRVDFV